MEDIIDIIVTETTNLIEITSQPTDEVIDVNIIDNREDITLNVTPSVVEININSLTGNFGVEWGDITGTLSNQTDLNTALSLKADLVDGKVPSSQLPSYVDDVVEVANYASLPATGEVGKIYITLDTNFIYRWTGSTYVEIKDSTAVWGAITGTLSSQTDLQNALNLKANDNAVVHNTGNETIAGQKTFTGEVISTIQLTSPTIKVQNSGNASLYSLLLTNSSGIRNVYLPDADGTIALTSNLHNPVTLGTANGLSLSTQVLSLGLASSSANGALSSTDWTTFNSKQAALSGTGFVKISGTTISYDNSTYALDSAVVKLTGNQTVAGIKTFSSNVIGNQFTVGTPFDTSRSFAAAGNQHSIALWLEEYTSTGGGAPDIFFNNGRGTISSKANIQVGDGLGGITWAGYVNGNFNGSVGLGASVVNIDSTNNQANADFSISQSYNSVSQTENLRVYANGGGLYIRGNVQGASFVKAGGTSAQFLKADGSIDSSTYLTTGTASSTYLPLSGGTLTGALEVNSDITIPNGNFYKAKRSTGSAAIGVLGFASGSDSLTVKGGTSGGNISIKFEDTGGTIAAFYNGNFGINTTSAAYKLDVNGTGNFAGTLRVSHSTSSGYGGIIYNTSSTGEGLTIRGGSTSSHNSLIVQNYNGSSSLLSVLANGVTTHTAVDDSGNRTNPFNSLIITTDNPSLPYGGFGGSILFNNRSYTHGIVTTSRIRSVIYDDGANQGGGFIFETTLTAGGTLTPSLSLTYDNFILIGKTAAGFSTAGSQFQNSGKLFGVTNDGSGENIFLHRSGSNTGNLMAFFYNAGGIGSISTNGTTTSYNITSDYRLKEDLKPINGLEIVNKIKVYDYKWKYSDSRMDGVMAHELAEVLPYAVTGIKDGEQMQSVDYSKIVPVMVQAIKDLKAELDTLKNK